ncbi:hypothetical protein LUZ63_013683 [Rhynchospora breviuscula]|uniref:O-fucosyltransferase family protein n=1 Tax=Rhynchospora breviuscula TaxID=2022672 RepID=A0A9Q0C910_9POAL|nr:hypothetical protein LUZ63_013683 [Rhynchospora breviuscula]
MFPTSKIKLIAYLGIALSAISLFVHLFIANSSAGGPYKVHVDDLYPVQKIWHRRLWGPVSSLETLHPIANATPRKKHPAPSGDNGFIYAKIYGDFEKIQSSISDLVAVSKLLNATLVIPEIQSSLRSKGISTKFKSFSYIYDEDSFISALSKDVVIAKTLPNNLKEARKKTKFPTFSTKGSESLNFYLGRVLPKLKESKAIGLIVSQGGCLQPILPPTMIEYQRLRCRVAFHALQFRSEVRALGKRIVGRLRAFGRPYLAYHPGLVRETLAYHGCAENFQDVHTELIQYLRKEMIKKGIIKEELSVDSFSRKRNGSCPLFPEEVGLTLRAMGYPLDTLIYVAGSETFGGQRILIPLRALYPNLLDRTSLSTDQERQAVVGPELPLPSDIPYPPPAKSPDELLEEWKRAGPRPRPLPPPPARPFYPHEKQGWYGWIAESETEPTPSLTDLRLTAHRLLWDAVDYYVSVEADAFFPGFTNGAGHQVDFAGLVMGHRLYQTPSVFTYRPDRKTLAELFGNITDNLYHPPRNWTFLLRSHLNKSLSTDGLITEAQISKSRSFLSHPLPECSCTTPNPNLAQYKGLEECPDWMVRGLALVSTRSKSQSEDEDADLLEDDLELDPEPDKSDSNRGADQDEEMDPDD